MGKRAFVSTSDEDLEVLWYLTKFLSKLDIAHWEPKWRKRINKRGVLERQRIIMVCQGAGPGYKRMMTELHAAVK